MFKPVQCCQIFLNSAVVFMWMQPTVIPSAKTEAFVNGLESADVFLDSEADTATKVSVFRLIMSV